MNRLKVSFGGDELPLYIQMLPGVTPMGFLDNPVGRLYYDPERELLEWTSRVTEGTSILLKKGEKLIIELE